MNMRNRFRRFFVPNSLRFQLLSRSLLVMAILLALIGLFQYVVMRAFVYQSKASSIQSQILALPPEAWQYLGHNAANLHPNLGDNPPGYRLNPGDNAPGTRLDRFSFFFLPDSTVAFIDTQGNFSPLPNFSKGGGTPPRLAYRDYQDALKSRPSLNYKVLNIPAEGEQLVVLQPIFERVNLRGNLVGLVQVSVGTGPLKAVLIRQLFTFLALSMLALIGGMLAFIPVLRKTLVPLSKMVDTVEQIDAGNLAERFPVQQGQMEVDRLAVSFNGMLERLEFSFAAEKEAREQMRRFVADASHELRTPLTSIHGFVEILLRGAMNQPDQLRASLQSMYAESERMKKLVQDLLLLARLDRSPNIQLSLGELDNVIMEMEPQLRLLGGNRQVGLELVPHLSCRFDEDKIKQVILNLFHNAIQHTDAETGQIELSLYKAGDGIELVVKDNGAGIPEEHLPHVFERFYRSESSRTRKSGGSGLGLSITKSIVELHGGTIRVESSPGEGSVFYVWLPAGQA